MTRALISRPIMSGWLFNPINREYNSGDTLLDLFRSEWEGVNRDEWIPRMDLSEKDGNYYLTAELPGLKKEDIEISVEGEYLTVSGKKEEEEEKETGEYHFKETKAGSFKRTFKLPGKIDEEKVDATHKDGVLTVVIPSEEASEVRKINVH